MKPQKNSWLLSLLHTLASWQERDSEKRRSRRIQFKQLPLGVLGVLIGVAIVSTGWSVYQTRDWPGLALNFGTEIAGAVVTYLMLEFVIGMRQRKDTLIAQVKSRVRDIAIPAVEELDRHNWLSDGSLNNIDLSNVNLEDAELLRASFEYANLVEGNLQRAKLYRANFQGAILQRVNFTDADLSFANLAEADLTNAILTRADLFHADLSGAFMSQINLQHAALQNANLQGAFMFAANLRGANLKNASLQNAFLENADLYNAKLEGAELEGAVYNSETVWPDDFNPDGAEMRKSR